ncbi:MAG: cupredoxin domain-containing protein [Acidimicrobiales bacterium]
MKIRLIIAAVALALLAAACGSDDSTTVGSGSGSARTVKVQMRDIAYSIDALDVKQGETITFEFKNTGKVDHDAFVGDEMAQADHEKEMAGGSDSGMNMDHGSDADAITVKPGKTETLTYTFDKAGGVLIGCHQTGHYAAGMKIVVTVS